MKQIDLDVKELPIVINVESDIEDKSFILRYDKEKDKVYLNKIV